MAADWKKKLDSLFPKTSKQSLRLTSFLVEVVAGEWAAPPAAAEG